MKRVYFFSTPQDISRTLEAFEACDPVKFVAYGQSETPNPPIYLTSGQIPSLGLATASTGSHSSTYLVSLQNSVNNIEKFINSDGQTRWIIENGNNEEAVVFTAAGAWDDDILLAGNMSTLHDSSQAQKLMRSFHSALKKSGCTKIDMWWVGPEALRMLKAGKRLATAAVESPVEYNLPLPDELRKD